VPVCAFVSGVSLFNGAFGRLKGIRRNVPALAARDSRTLGSTRGADAITFAEIGRVIRNPAEDISAFGFCCFGGMG
jgi:hypothetical protein